MKFVDMEQLLAKSGLAEQETVHLRKVNARLMQSLELAGQHYDQLDAQSVLSARQADQQMAKFQWHQAQQSARKAVLAAVSQAALAWQDEHGAVAILPRQAAIAVSADADITNDLADKLKYRKVVFGELPDVVINPQGPAVSH